MSGDFEKALRRATIKTFHKGAQTIADVRRIWETWTPEEKAAFKSVVDDSVALQDKAAQFVPRVYLRLDICEQVGEDEFTSVSPRPSVLKEAIECWERGEYFTPEGIFGYCG